MFSLTTMLCVAVISATETNLRESTDIKKYTSDIKFCHGLTLIKQNWNVSTKRWKHR